MRDAFAKVLVVGLVLLTGACGGSGNDNAGTGTGTGGSGDEAPVAGEVREGKARLVVTFDVEGEIALKGTVTDTVLPTTEAGMISTCAEYADGGKNKEGERIFVLPLSLGGDLRGENVSLQVNVRDYAGPGNYTEDQLYAPGVSFGVLVGNKPYVAQGDDSGSIVNTDAAGGGMFYFENLAYSTGGDTSPGIAGQISWTCED